MSALAGDSGHVILIDTYELLAPLDGWLRESFLPQLPSNVLVVLAGRNRPDLAWRSDPGWQSVMRLLPLRNLDRSDSRAYLANRSIPAEQQDAVLDFTHGHPLALSLVADVFAQRDRLDFRPESAPDVIKTLLEQFVQKVPGPAHRGALESCALVRLMTEPLLAVMLDIPDVHELFEWLRGLSFMEAERLGLFPHDLAREALAADLRWRNPEWYVELHRRARNYYLSQLQPGAGQQPHRVLSDYVFLHRDNPVVRPYFEWQAGGSVFADALRPGDERALLATVAHHEGPESADYLAYWVARQPEGVVVLRGASHDIQGLLVLVSLRSANAAELEPDPATRAAWKYLQSHAPLRPGESATLFRFWLAQESYQSVSPVQSRIFITMVQHYLATPGLAYTFIPCADPAFWAPVFTYGDLHRLPEADFTVAGHPYGIYGHDWRATPPMAWLSLLAEREIGSEAAPVAPASDPVIVLSQAEFANAILGALRHYAEPHLLADNPLLQSRLIVERAGAGAGRGERVTTLQKLIANVAATLQQSPRQSKLYRALFHTYLQPAPTQERASEILDIPFSSFRRHLKGGIERVTDILWQLEVGGAEK
jgi:hypothetical protein